MKFICFLLQDRFEDWESSGVKVVPVLSQPENDWTGESGYVQVGLTLAVSLSFFTFAEIVGVCVNRPEMFSFFLFFLLIGCLH